MKQKNDTQTTTQLEQRMSLSALRVSPHGTVHFKSTVGKGGEVN